MKGKKIVMLVTEGAATNMVFHGLKARFPIERVIIERPVARLTFLKSRVAKLGLLTVVGQIGFQGLVVPLLRLFSKRRFQEIREHYNLEDSVMAGTTITRVDSVNSEKTRELLEQLAPDVVVVNGTRIISSKTIKCVSAPFINMHAGITPLFRGVHGGYWALVTDRREACGVTVHLVDAGIDSGEILYQDLIMPGRHDNFFTYPYLQLGKGIPLLVSAVEAALNGALPRAPKPLGESRLWSHPTLWSYTWNALTRGIK